MKKLRMFCLLLLLCGGTAYSQLLLLPDQSWTYEFSTLPYQGAVSAFDHYPRGLLSFTIDTASWQPGSRLDYAIYENDTMGVAIASGTLNSLGGRLGCDSMQSWQDRQGAIRFHMVSGSVILESVTLEATVSGPSLSSFDRYSDTFAPVPEPAAIVLLGLGVLMASIWKVHRKTEL